MSINVKWADKHLLRADELFRKKRFQEAEPFLTEGYNIVSKQMTPETPLLAQTRADLSTISRATHHPVMAQAP